MPFGKELSHLIAEQINRSVDHKTTSMNSTGNASRSGGDDGRIAQLEANVQKLGEKFTSYLSSQKKSKRNVVDYGLTVIALHELRLAVTAGRAIFVDRDEPLDVPYTYLQLSSAGSERQIRYIYLDSTGVVLESTTDPTNIGTGYIPLAMVDVWTGISEITQDKIKDIRPRAGAEESTNNAQNTELNGNVTLYSPDTGNDSFVVSATNPAGLKVNVTSGRALVDGEMLNAEGGLLDVTSHRTIVKEFIVFSDGTTKNFNLYHKSVSNVVVYVNDVVASITVDDVNGSITFATAPIQDAKITVSYTFSGNYMLVFLVEKAQTNDGKSFGVVNWKLGTNRSASEPPGLASYQHAIAKVDMSSSITAITNEIIDNSYEVKNLTQYDLQYGGKLDGSSLRVGAITGDKIAAQSITGNKIVAGSIDAAKIVSGAIQAGHIATGTIQAGHIATGAIQAGHIAANAIQAGNIATGAIMIGNLDSTTQSTINTSYSTANTALNNAATAQGTANTAVTNASTANNLLTDMANDDKITPVEKHATKQEWDGIVSEYTLNLAQATTFAITTTKTAYTTAYNALNAYITPLLTSLSTTSVIVGTTFRANFKTYYDARTNLLNAIALSAKILANDAQTTADGKASQVDINNTLSSQNLALTFTNIVGCTITGNNAIKTGTSGWNAGFSSTKTLTNGEYAEYTVSSLAKSSMFGLSNVVTGTSYTTIDFAIYQQSGNILSVYETGASKAIGSPAVVLGDKLRIAIENDVINYYKNGKLLYTSLKVPVLPLLLHNSINSTGCGFNNITVGSMLSGISEAITSAQATANTAVTNAQTANNLLADLSNDNKLTPSEKQSIKSEWDMIVSEVALNDTQATTFGIATQKTTYDTAYSTLSTYVTPLLTNLTTTSDIVGTTFRSNFKAYYDARTNLLNAIALSVRTTANTAVTNASTAQTTASTAVTNAGTANALLADIANDDKLTPSEKHSTKQEWDMIASEYILNLAQATTFSITTTKTAYTTAYNALNTYITPLLSSLTTTTAIVGATFRSTFKTYYDARTNLLNAIATATEAKANTAVTNASNAQTTANTAVTNAGIANTQINAWKYTGTTYIDGGDIYTGTITANQIASNAITAVKISAGAITADKIATNAITADMITTGTLSANLIYQAGYQVKANVMVKGTVAHGGTIPLPSGYTEGQCTWGVLQSVEGWVNSTYDQGIHNINVSVNANRVVTAIATYSSRDNSDADMHTVNIYGSAYYWIMGVK